MAILSTKFCLVLEKNKCFVLCDASEFLSGLESSLWPSVSLLDFYVWLRMQFLFSASFHMKDEKFYGFTPVFT